MRQIQTGETGIRVGSGNPGRGALSLGADLSPPGCSHFSVFSFNFPFSSSGLRQSAEMAGAIIENMSTKKLVIVGVVLLLFQAFAFMVGGLIGECLGNSGELFED